MCDWYLRECSYDQVTIVYFNNKLYTLCKLNVFVFRITYNNEDVYSRTYFMCISAEDVEKSIWFHDS